MPKVSDKDYQRPLPTFSTIILAVAIGAIVGAGVFQLGQQGKLSFLNNLSKASVNNLPFSSNSTQRVVNEESAVTDVVDKASPSVVAIGATQKTFNPFDPFSAPRSTNSTIGTGFVVSDSAGKIYIVTNRHVVDDTSLNYEVVTKDTKKFEIQKIYRDPILDLAIVQVNNDGTLKPLELGDSSKLKVGQSVVAIGNALGQFTNTVTTGIVSGLGRQVSAGDPYSGSSESLSNLIQTDAAINPGNSGGPLLNLAGQVIGVNVATTEGAQNIGFAVPINSVRQIVDQFVQNGTVSRPYLGIRYRFIDPDLSSLRNVPVGAYVQDVISGSGADKAGIKVGDVITKIDGKDVSDDGIISGEIANKKIGDTVNLNVWNNGNNRSVNAGLQELPNQ